MKLQKKTVRMPKKDYYQYSITVTPKYVKACHLEDKDLQWEINKAGYLQLVEK